MITDGDIDILGQQYHLMIHGYHSDPIFAQEESDGYINNVTREIVICDLSTNEEWNSCSAEEKEAYEKLVMRHEIVHAFLNESGLWGSSHKTQCGWARDEEIIDWIAIQSPKIYQAYKSLGLMEEGKTMNRQEVIDALNLIKDVYLKGGNVGKAVDELIIYFDGDYKGFASLSEIYEFLRTVNIGGCK